MNINNYKEFHRSVFIRDKQVLVTTDGGEDYQYTYSLYEGDKKISQSTYTVDNKYCFDVPLSIGDYSVRFYYKKNDVIKAISENFIIIDRAGVLDVSGPEVKSLFVDENDYPTIKRLLPKQINKSSDLIKNSIKSRESYPGMIFDVIVTELMSHNGTVEYMYTAIDTFSKELYASILPAMNFILLRNFIDDVTMQCPYKIYSLRLINTNIDKNGIAKFLNFCKKNNLTLNMFRDDLSSESFSYLSNEIKNINIRTADNINDDDLRIFINNYNVFHEIKEIGNYTPHQKLNEYFQIE